MGRHSLSVSTNAIGLRTMERGTSCYKDLGTYVTEDCGNLSESLLKIAQNVCMQFYLDDRLAGLGASICLLTRMANIPTDTQL